MSSDDKFGILVLVGVFCFISMMIGVLEGRYNECKYQSILSRFNPAYMIGCELSKPRWNLNE